MPSPCRHRPVDLNAMYVTLFVFGLLCFSVGVASLRRSRELYAKGQETEAVVTAVEETVTTGTGTRAVKAWRAVYSYQDQDGNTHQMRGSRTSTARGSFTLGERKTVVFNPDFPEEVLDTSARVYAGSVFYLAMAVAMMAAGVAGFLFDRD